jgi:hypothetical protein
VSRAFSAGFMTYERQRRYSSVSLGQRPRFMNPKRGSAESASQSTVTPGSVPDIMLVEIDAVLSQ